MDYNASEYLTQEVQSADPARLVELLFQRALRDLRGAHELWPELAQSPAAIHLVVHAQCILMELQRSLNFEAGGQVAAHLSRLYQFMQGQLVEATARQRGRERQQVQDVIEILAGLSDAWSEMSQQQQHSEKVPVSHANLVA